MESLFLHDFSRVRVHVDAKAGESAQAVGALAYTAGRDVIFAPGYYAPESERGRSVLAHELAHVVQQRAAVLSNPTRIAPADDPAEKEAQSAAAAASRGGTAIAVPRDNRADLQRFEAGEHAQMGETQAELKKAFRPITYEVKQGETLTQIADKFDLTVQELKAANPVLLKTWPAADGSGRAVAGFNQGEKISIPQKLNELAQGMIKDPSAKITVNGIVLDYGVVIAMGDLFESPSDLAKASPAELQEISALVKREQSTGKLVATAEWQKATRGRFLDLATKNAAHFAPPDPALTTTTTAGAAEPNHRREWEKHHRIALDTSKSGDKDRALLSNAFGDHFLTDAFSAGHLFNKRDVMERFKGHLTLDSKGEEFTATSKAFFDSVAQAAFTGSVKSEFSKYETVDYKGIVFRPNIDRESRFSTLLQEIQKKEPDLLGGAVAKGTHDRLNLLPTGLPVHNEKGDKWSLSGDATLSSRPGDRTLEIARTAVAQSQLNVISVYMSRAPLAYTDLFKKVWDFTPKLDPAGQLVVTDAIDKGTDINSADLRKAVVNLIDSNYLLIIDALVQRNKLKKA